MIKRYDEYLTNYEGIDSLVPQAEMQEQKYGEYVKYDDFIDAMAMEIAININNDLYVNESLQFIKDGLKEKY